MIFGVFQGTSRVFPTPRYKFIKSPYLALEARLMSLYFDTKQYNMCLKLGQRLYSELKKLDDKALLVEIQLTESKVSHQL